MTVLVAPPASERWRMKKVIFVNGVMLSVEVNANPVKITELLKILCFTFITKTKEVLCCS